MSNRVPGVGLALLLAALLTPASAAARDQIRIVGSSTVYPFATVVAEEFGRSSSFKTPIIESTGSGGGLKLFCAGVGVGHPDITNASRRIKQSEVDLCASNGVAEITEIQIGYDGIVLANSRKAPKQALTLRQVFLALAKDVPAPNGELVPNPPQTWKDVDPSLPDVPIEVLGPPPTSGTRDAFNELALEGGCKTFPDLAALKKSDKSRYKQVCRSVREDGKYVEAEKMVEREIMGERIYPRSYQDSNGDGIGDLAGIIQRLPYIAGLGADAIWISPFFKSPMKDFGYDVSDYCDVDPMFGTLGSLFASGPRLKYDLGREFAGRAFGVWTHRRGTCQVRRTNATRREG